MVLHIPYSPLCTFVTTPHHKLYGSTRHIQKYLEAMHASLSDFIRCLSPIAVLLGVCGWQSNRYLNYPLAKMGGASKRRLNSSPPSAAWTGLGQPWFRQCLVACSAPSHCLDQCWLIVNSTLRNKLQWNSNQNTKLFIHENAYENVVCEMAAILSRRELSQRAFFYESLEWRCLKLP